MKIEIYTRSMNWKLYKLSEKTIQLPYKKHRCRFTSADGYFYYNVLKSSADIVINIDEDAFVSDNNSLKNLLEFFIENDYVNCGVPDGGVMEIRKHNPVVTNPFFNILNVSKLKKEFDISNIINNYSKHNPDFEKYAPTQIIRTQYAYDFYEPYVPFFLWVNTNFKTLFLNAGEHHDGYSNEVYDHEGNPFLLHSWYSRFYGKDEFHTNRINNLYKEVSNELPSDDSSFPDQIIKRFDSLGMKYYFPLKSRIENKLKRQLIR